MEIHESTERGVLVLEPVGRLDSERSPDFETNVRGHLASGAIRVVFDLGQIHYVSSAGLRVFLTTAKKLAKTAGGLVVCEVSPEVDEIFEMVGFKRILSFMGSRAEAVEKLAEN